MNKSVKRPLSPHLQIYQWEITSVTSALHRITSLISCVGLVWLVTFFFLSTASGMQPLPELFMEYSEKVTFLGIPLLWAISYQLLSNIRHLFWDFNIGIDISASRVSGYAILALSFGMTGVWHWLLI